MVKLRIWSFDPLLLNIGHASLEVVQKGTNNYRYMSVWPSGRFDNKGTTVSKAFDLEQEGGDCWYQITFSNLDEIKMIKYWDYLSKNNSLTYSNAMYGFNCMTNAALFLLVGKGLDPIENAWNLLTIQEHWSLMWYAKGMKWKGW
jgi:hypothetical protein